MIENVFDWLPNDYSLPKDWKVGRVKDLAEYQSGKYIDANEIDEEGIYDVYGGNGLRGKTFNYNHNGQYILIGRQGALCGNINIASGMFWATEHAIVVYKKNKYSLKWIAHIFNVMNLNQYSISAAQPGLAIDRIKRLKLPVPPLQEQQAIANYLDAKTQAIDKKVALLEQKIETYKKLKRTLINQTITKGLDKNAPLKDSGIAWIGKIPQHWEVKRLKELGNIETSSINKKIEEGEDLVKLVNYTDVYSNLKREIWNNDDYMIVSANKLQISSKKLKQGDVLFTPSSETINDIGVSAVVMENLHNTLYSYHLLRLRFRKVVDLHFKKYLFSNDYVQYYFSKSATGTTRKILGLNTFNNLIIPLPPKSEQEEIAKYLDHKTATIDAIVGNISKQIETLKQLRKTLINDVVTGKIKVCDD